LHQGIGQLGVTFSLIIRQMAQWNSATATFGADQCAV